MANRKFFYGDNVVVKSKEHYPRHIGHRAIVVGTVLYRPKGKKSKVNYKVECACGTKLSPQGDHMDLYTGPVYWYDEKRREYSSVDFNEEEWVDVPKKGTVHPVHEIRLQHFLDLIEFPLKDMSLEQQVELVLAPLKERDRYIIQKRFGLDGKPSKNLREIAEGLSISKARVGQLEHRLLERLRR